VQNQLGTMADRWRSESSPGAGLYSRAIRNDYAFGFSAATTKYLFDGSYVRIRNVNLSYAFPQSVVNKLKMQALIGLCRRDQPVHLHQLSRATTPKAAPRATTLPAAESTFLPIPTRAPTPLDYE
jgi:hypothetical protein